MDALWNPQCLPMDDGIDMAYWQSFLIREHISMIFFFKYILYKGVHAMIAMTAMTMFKGDAFMDAEVDLC